MPPSSIPARDRLVDAGLRVTAPRLAVLEVLDSIDGHVTADEVRREVVVRIGSVSVQAGYDVLAALSRAGLIRCIETPDTRLATSPGSETTTTTSSAGTAAPRSTSTAPPARRRAWSPTPCPAASRSTRQR